MMLRTLKDFNTIRHSLMKKGGFDDIILVRKDELRINAIKWIAYQKEEIKKLEYKIQMFGESEYYDSLIFAYEILIERLAWFFNVTEDELVKDAIADICSHPKEFFDTAKKVICGTKLETGEEGFIYALQQLIKQLEGL